MSQDFLSAMMSLMDGEEVRENYIRAPFGYPGAKSRALENILPRLSYRNSYGEPFGGSGAVLLSRRPSNLEIFNDRYSGVVSFYRVVRDKQKLPQLLDRLLINVHAREEFIFCRDTWKNCDDDVERAARWYYMVRCSFGQQGRNFARSTSGKAQIGQKFHNGLELFQPVHDRLRNVQIENLDWRQCLKDYDREEMVWYLDPPYYKVWKGIYDHEMPDEDHEELLHRIFMLKGFVAISSYPNELYDNPKWKWNSIHEWSQRTSANGFAFTETNNKVGFEEETVRRPSIERLYVKE